MSDGLHTFLWVMLSWFSFQALISALLLVRAQTPGERAARLTVTLVELGLLSWALLLLQEGPR